MRPGEVAGEAQRQVEELTGHAPETVSGLHGDDGTWVVLVEALELERTPNTMDLLGSYEVTLDDGGELTGFRRLRRYHRASTRSGEGD